MIESIEVLGQQKEIDYGVEENENEVFESVSEQSDLDIHQQSQTQLDYTLTPIQFPPPEPNTLKLLAIYQQNTHTINLLKQQISRLSQIKKQDLFIKNDCVKINYQQQQSQFFIRSQQLYKQRQQSIKQIKSQINTIDQQQLTTLMSKNQHITNLANIYFLKFRKIIDAKITQKLLILLTQQKRRSHQKKKRRNQQLQQQNLIDKLHKSINTRSLSSYAVKNKSQQKISSNIQPSTTGKYEQQRSDNGSKISTPRRRQNEKFNSMKRMFNIRFVPLGQLFSQLEEEQSQKEKREYCYSIGAKLQSVPKQIVYDDENKLILVLYSTNTIFGYSISQNSQQQEQIKQHSISNKSHHAPLGHNKLKQLQNFKIQLDTNISIVLFQLNQQSLYIGTSDGVLRVYYIKFNPVTKLLSCEIKCIMYCLNNEQDIGQIQYMALSNKTNQVYLVTDHKKLCRLDINKYRTQIIHKCQQQVISLTNNYLQTINNIYFNYSNCNKNKQQLIPTPKQDIDGFNINMNKQQREQLLRVCSVIIGGIIYIIRVNKHGLIKGYVHVI